MGQALYRKHRPKTLKDVVGQEHVTKTLEQALKQGRISHAYLFTGPRGVGKTSVARILAHQINGLPYDDDSSHIDIIEIDAASNRRIDEIRELRDKVYIAPVSGKYKVYIIDEVHMLTKEAFNALLKTLEEPPAHAVFILATTEAHKLPDTIISRTQRFTFKPVDKAEVVAHLAELAKDEKIKISPEALGLLAEHGEGSFRDSISLLDQLGSHDGKVDAEDVRRLLGVPPAEAIDGLIECLSGGSDKKSLMNSLEALFTAGYQPAGIAKQLGQRLRQRMLDDDLQGMSEQSALELLARLIEVPVSHEPGHFLEITLLEAMPAALKQRVPKAEATPDSEDVTPDPDPAAQEEQVERAPKTAAAKGAEPKASERPAGDAKFDESLWPQVLQTLKHQHNTLYGVVRMAKPSFKGDTLNLTFAFAFHEKRINESSNRQKLADVIYGLTGKSVKVECRLDPSEKPLKTEPEAGNPASEADLSAISNIFGTAELLES